MKLYISGPITGNEDTAPDRFGRAAKALEAVGYEVLNPLEVCPVGMSHEEAMKRDLQALIECDAVCELFGSWLSEGSRVEREVAEAIGLPVRNLDQWIEVHDVQRPEQEGAIA